MILNKRCCFVNIKKFYISLLSNFFSSDVKYPNNIVRNRLFKMKIETDEFKSIFTPGLNSLVAIFNSKNYEIRIAGGAVRDILLGKHPTDIDFATTATPLEMKEMFDSNNIRMINDKGEKHGTITARIEEENFEVTTLRIDVTSDGRYAEVEFTKNWELDANRRDLTINSMFLGIDGTLYDYFDGYEDLKNRRVVFVGSPKKRIQEDYLRILRYFRFYGRITEKPDIHDEGTILAIKDNIEGLKRISGERIWQELSKICSGNYVSSILQVLLEVGAAPYIGLPKEPNINELKCVWEKSKNYNLHPITILTALLNNEQELLNFHCRCKISSYEKDLGLFIIENRNNINTLTQYKSLMFKSDRKASDIRSFIIELLKYKDDLALLHEFQTWEPPKFPLKGNTLVNLGVPSGKFMGKIMKVMKMKWIDSDFKLTEDEMIHILPTVEKELRSKKS